MNPNLRATRIPGTLRWFDKLIFDCVVKWVCVLWVECLGSSGTGKNNVLAAAGEDDDGIAWEKENFDYLISPTAPYSRVAVLVAPVIWWLGNIYFRSQTLLPADITWNIINWHASRYRGNWASHSLSFAIIQSIDCVCGCWIDGTRA